MDDIQEIYSEKSEIDLKHCPICNLNYRSKTAFRNHMQKHHNRSDDRLTCCDLVFPTHAKYLRHLEIHKLNIQCEHCGKAFSRNSTLKQHIKVIHEKKKLFTCDYCGHEFAEKQHVRKHIESRRCRGGKPTGTNVPSRSRIMTTVYCQFCDKKFSYQIGLAKHIKYCRSNFRRCKTCDLILLDRTHFENHLKVHADNELIKCQLCDHQFLHIFEHTMHLQTHNAKTFKCEVCLKEYKSKSQLKEHRTIHTERVKFECDLCGKQFVKKQGVETHMHEKHIGIREYMCETCGASFFRSSDLKRHMEGIHSDVRPFKCNVCQKAFKRLSTLRIHQLLHDVSKPFKCEFCDKSYTQSYSLKEHTLLHTNPLKCTTCGQSFTRIKRLNEHYTFNNCVRPPP